MEKRTWPRARARRWVGGFGVVEMRWISEVGVRWGRLGGGEAGGVGEVDEAGGADGGAVGDCGGGILGGVVVIVRVEVEELAGVARRWRGIER